MTANVRLILTTVLIAGGAFVCIAIARFAFVANGSNGFPLDDAWIHLQFAKNLHDFGSFSYYKNSMVTSGSTSPLYTILLSAGFFFTSNEMILSYVLGIFFSLAGAVYFIKILDIDYPGDLATAAGATIIFLLEPRLLWSALSGMETSMFIALLLAAFFYYKKRMRIALGVTGGLLLWTRPEALLFMILLGLDSVYHAFIVEPRNKKEKKNVPPREKSLDWAKLPAAIFIIFAGGYLGFNMALSGSIFPNTYAAKIKYYANGGADYPSQVFHYFTDNHLFLISLLAAIGIIVFVATVARKGRTGLFIPVLFAAEMFLVYWKNLPYLYQEGRYLMPVIPFFLLVAVHGLDSLISFFRRSASAFFTSGRVLLVQGIVFVILCVQVGSAGWKKRVEYADYCKYISDRQVKTARWLHDNLPEDAVVATHDVGAIAYYSGRKIVDMVGLISPEMISRIGNLDALIAFMNAKKVTHLALLRNWFEADNVERIFTTDPDAPEIMEVFRYDPKSIHFVGRDVGEILESGRYYRSIGDLRAAGSYFAQAVRRDPRSSTAHALLGEVFLQSDNDNARNEFDLSLRLNPSNFEAVMGMAQVRVKNRQPSEAAKLLEGYIAAYPARAPAYRLLADIYSATPADSGKASAYRKLADEIEGGGVR